MVFSHLDLFLEEQQLKDMVDNKFVMYMSVLRFTNVIAIHVRVFCHMTSKDKDPQEFKNYNDCCFQKLNMEEVLRILDGLASPQAMEQNPQC